MTDLSKLSVEDLKAIEAGDLSKVSVAGLRSLTGENEAYQRGKSEGNPIIRGLANVINGPLMGFGDELLGAGQAVADKIAGAPGSFSDNYQARRDFLRGVQDQYKQDFPIGSAATQLAASAPAMLANPVGATASAIAPQTAARVGQWMNAPRVGMSSMIPRAVSSGASGLTYGAIGGAGESTADTALGVGVDAVKSGAIGLGLGVAAPGVGALGMGGYNAIAPRFNESAAMNFAKQKVAEAFTRDARGSVFESGASNAGSQIASRFGKLGPEARIVDAGGQNTRQLLDTTATLPGRTKNLTENAIRERQAGRAGRLTSAADDALGTRNKQFASTLEELDSMRKTAAAPFYEQLQPAVVTVDDDIVRLLNRTKGHHGEAQNLYRVQTGQEVNLASVKPGDTIPFSVMDTLKQTLYDVASTSRQAGGKQMANAIDDARTALISKLDDVSPKNEQGQSIYKLARDAYAGPSQLMDAAELGRKAMREDVFDMKTAMRGFTSSETEAFRVGALQALREKTGTQSGQTSLLKMWMEPATQERLKTIFGNNYREFSAAVAREARLKGLDGVGRGSQTASRQFGAGDLDLSPLTQAATAVQSGSPTGMLAAGASMWNRVKTPEPVRDQIGSLLLSRDPAIMQELNLLTPMLTAERNRRAATAGRYSGLLANSF